MSQAPDPEIFGYTITRQDDKTLQFSPAIGSVELANALSYKYPLEPDLESKLRRAILDYVREENTANSISAQSSNIVVVPTQTSPGRPKSTVFTTTWSITTGISPRRKRKKFDPETRKKVAEVRKRGACKNCRRRKVACNHPDISASSNSPPPGNDTTAKTPSLRDSEQGPE